MVQTSHADPFDALVANGVTAAGPDPSAEQTVLIDGSEDEVVWLPPREPEPEPAVEEPLPQLPPPWFRTRLARRVALAVTVLAAAAVATVALWPEVEIPPPPTIPRFVAPVEVRQQPEPAPVAKPAKRATRPAPRPAGFAPWPGERTTANPPPRDGEPLKRPSF